MLMDIFSDFSGVLPDVGVHLIPPERTDKPDHPKLNVTVSNLAPGTVITAVDLLCNARYGFCCTL